MKNLTSAYKVNERFKKAKSLQVALMRPRIESFGEESPAAITSMVDLEVNYHNQDLYELGAKHQLDALHRQTKSLGPEDPATIVRMLSVGVEWANLNRLVDAETITRDVVALARKVLERNHPTYRYALSNLAGMCNNLTKYEEAEEL
jgi:hypothetical protein